MAAAVHSLTLTTGLRLARNFSVYRKRLNEEEKVYRDQILCNINEAVELSYTLHNLLMKDESQNAPFLVAIARQISDRLDEIHQNVIIYSADNILNIIPPLDSLRNRWKSYTETEFYDDRLSHHIEHQFPLYMSRIHSKVRVLPYFAKL